MSVINPTGATGPTGPTGPTGATKLCRELCCEAIHNEVANISVINIYMNCYKKKKRCR